jgi:excisionase family DNA binding protein
MPEHHSGRSAIGSTRAPMISSRVGTDDAYLSIREFAALLRVDHKTVRTAIAEGRIPVVRLGRVIRIHRSVLEMLATQARVATPDGKPHGRST